MTITAGPWFALDCGNPTEIVIANSEQSHALCYSVATVWGCASDIALRPEVKANARLIAAAPDLLDACKQLLAAVDLLHGPLADSLMNGAATRATKAIARAEAR